MSETPTPADTKIRSRLEEIAVEACVDTSDATEPLDELIDRIRFSLQEELATISNHFDELEEELDELEDVLADGESQSQTEQQP